MTSIADLAMDVANHINEDKMDALKKSHAKEICKLNQTITDLIEAIKGPSPCHLCTTEYNKENDAHCRECNRDGGWYLFIRNEDR